MNSPIVIAIVVVVIAVIGIAGSAVGYVLYRKKKKQTTTTPENTALEQGYAVDASATLMAGTKEATKPVPTYNQDGNEAVATATVATATVATAKATVINPPAVGEEAGSIGSSINKPQRKYTRRALSPPSLLADKLELGSEQEAMELFDKYMQAGIVDSNVNKGFYSNAVATLRGTLKQSVRRQKSTRTTETSSSSPLDQMFAMVIEEEATAAAAAADNSKLTKADRRTSIFNTLTRNGGGQRQKRNQANPWIENEAAQQ